MLNLTYILLNTVPSCADWIQAFASIFSVIISIYALSYAKETINSWEDDKFHDYIIEAELVHLDTRKVFTDFLYRVENELIDNNHNQYLASINDILKDTEQSLKLLNFNEHNIKLSKVKNSSKSAFNSNIIVKKFYDLKNDYFKIKDQIYFLAVNKNADHQYLSKLNAKLKTIVETMQLKYIVEE